MGISILGAGGMMRGNFACVWGWGLGSHALRDLLRRLGFLLWRTSCRLSKTMKLVRRAPALILIHNMYGIRKHTNDKRV